MTDRVRSRAFDVDLIAAFGAGAPLAHVGWYRLFETSVTVDVGGSILLGGVFALGSGVGICRGRPLGPS